MAWWEQLGKDTRGSRPRCVLLVDGARKDVAERLTRLVNFPDVVVSPDDKWMPYGKPTQKNGAWDKAPSNEAELDKADALISLETSQQLKTWWLAVARGTTPNWDIASTCRIEGKDGLLLVEAKAHENELATAGKDIKRGSSENSKRNHEQIGQAIDEAQTKLQTVIGGCWGISRDTHYQLSNRFAWSWKLVTLGIPVVLLYLGFLDAQDMSQDGPLFRSEAYWGRVLKGHCNGIVPEGCWGKPMGFRGSTLHTIGPSM